MKILKYKIKWDFISLDNLASRYRLKYKFQFEILNKK